MFVSFASLCNKTENQFSLANMQMYVFNVPKYNTMYVRISMYLNITQHEYIVGLNMRKIVAKTFCNFVF